MGNDKPNETGPIAERASVRNRAILWLLYDTGIRVSELTNLRVGDLDRKHGVITVLGKGSKERRIALGQNCLRNLLYYLDKHRPNEEELAEWGSAGEDHAFLSETRQPLTKNGVELLFKRLKARAGIVGKRISPHIFRHTFAINYLVQSNDPFSLQELLGHEDMTTVKNYMHMNDATIQDQKRKYSPGDHIPARMPGHAKQGARGSRQKSNKRKNRRVRSTCLPPSFQMEWNEGGKSAPHLLDEGAEGTELDREHEQSQIYVTRASSQSVNSTSLSWRGVLERSKGSLIVICRSSASVYV